jgi:hypothetical protein
METTYLDALETVYVEACRQFRNAHGDEDESALWGRLCFALEECYPGDIERFRR